MKLTFLDRGTAEWDRVWALLAADTGGDIEQRCSCCYEVWQYMGSVAEGDRVAHEFRHRHNPYTAKREYRQFRETRA